MSANKVTITETPNTISVASGGTAGPQGDAGQITSATASASNVAVNGDGSVGTATVNLNLGGTSSQRTMAFAFGLPVGASGVIQSVAVTTANGLKVNTGTSSTANSATNTLAFTINAQDLWTHILNGNVTGTALVVTDGSSATNIALEGTVTLQGTSNEVEVSNSGGTFTVGLVANPVVSGITSGNVKVGVTGDNEIDTSSGNLTLDSAGGTVSVDDNLTVTGNLTVNGTTTTVNTTNTKVTDNLLELNSGASSNANDSGILIERGSTGDNAIIMWDESTDKFQVGTTTADAASTGDISVTTATLIANIEGNVTGNITGITDQATEFTVSANNSADETVYLVFVDGATGSQGAETDTGLNYNPSTGNLTSTVFTGNLTGNVTGNVGGNLTGTVNASSSLADGVTATTQSTGDNSTKVATTAYVDGLVGNQDLDFVTDDGSGAVDLDTQSLSVLGGEGMNVTHVNQVITVAGEDASTSNKGVASFSSDHFSASSGAISLKTDGIDTTHLDYGTGTNQINTDALTEGSTNQYHTTARARSSISATGTGVAYNNSTGVITSDAVDQALALSIALG